MGFEDILPIHLIEVGEVFFYLSSFKTSDPWVFCFSLPIPLLLNAPKHHTSSSRCLPSPKDFGRTSILSIIERNSRES